MTGQHAAARRLHAWGLPVFPCQPGGKRPLTPNGFHDATTDPDRIEAWWQRWPTANPAIPTGQVSGVVVLDIDPRHGGTATYLEWTATNTMIFAGLHPVVVLTGGGGYHHYYARPGRTVPNSTNAVHGHRPLPGIDVRGDGGYVLAPGAITDAPYEALQPLDPTTMDPWPDQLTPPEPRTRAPRPAGPFGRPHGPTRHLYEGLARFLADAVEGQRHDRTHWALRRLHDDGAPLDQAVDAVTAAVAPTGYTAREVLAVARSIWRTPPT